MEAVNLLKQFSSISLVANKSREVGFALPQLRISLIAQVNPTGGRPFSVGF
jgi:hypothetical protein